MCICGDDNCQIPYGYCHCGACGLKTSVAKENNRRSGYVKGEPLRFVIGHCNTIAHKGYRKLKPRTEVVQPTDSRFRLLPLTQGKATLVDQFKWDELIGLPWAALKTMDGKYYAACSIRNADGTFTSKGLHNYLMNPSPGFVADHINRETLDNRLSNLRVIPSVRNPWNTGVFRNSLSGIKGVRKQKNRYLARIYHNGKHIHIGSYLTEEEADAAYRAKVRELRGKEYEC